jgi:predicted esterase
MRALALAILLLAPQDEVPSEDRRAKDNADQRYFFIGPKPGQKEPEAGWGLILVLPGGDGAAGFHPFVKRIFANSAPPGFVAAQLVAVEWMPGQSKTLTWPTKPSPAPGMKFTTEEFVSAVIDDVSKKTKIDPARILTLSWSSGGPPVYVLSTGKDRRVKGSLIAMSVFHEKEVDLPASKGYPYYLYHSRDDQRCRFEHAEKAKEKLAAAGARVELATYEGGHGWGKTIYPDLRKGFAWLLENGSK